MEQAPPDLGEKPANRLLNQRTVIAEARARRLEMENNELRSRLRNAGLSTEVQGFEEPESEPPAPEPDPAVLEELNKTRSRLSEAEKASSESVWRLKMLEEKVAAGERQIGELKTQLEEQRLAATAEQAKTSVDFQELMESRQRALDATQLLLEVREQYQASEQELRQAISQEQARSTEMERLAYTDPLTGLPNLFLLQQGVDFNARRAERREVTTAVLHVEIENFAYLQDLTGESGAQEIALQVAERLRKLVPHEGVLGRAAPNQFMLAVIVPTGRAEVPGQASNAAALARALAQQVKTTLSAPFTVGGLPLALNTRIGVSQMPGASDSGGELLEHARRALRQAPPGGLLVYTEDHLQAAERELQLQTDLRKGFELREFRVIFHPVVEVPRGLMAGACATVAWYHPQTGVHGFEEFLMQAERASLSASLGTFCLTESCNQLRKLKSGFMVFDLTQRQLLDPALPAALTRTCSEARIRPEELVLTVPTQLVLENAPRFQAFADQVQQWGVGLALRLDSVGPIPLGLLQDRNFKLLRVARAVMESVLHDENSARACKALIGVAKSLGLRCLAEGVDSPVQAKFAAAHGCDLAMGGYFSPPVNGDELVGLKRQTWKF